MYFYYLFRNNREIGSVVLHPQCENDYICQMKDTYLIRGSQVKQPRAICVLCKHMLDEKAAKKYLNERLETKPLRDLKGLKIISDAKKFSLLCGEECILENVDFEEIKSYVYRELKPSSKIKDLFEEILFNKLLNAKRKS